MTDPSHNNNSPLDGLRSISKSLRLSQLLVRWLARKKTEEST